VVVVLVGATEWSLVMVGDGRLPERRGHNVVLSIPWGWVVDLAFDAKRDAGLRWAGAARNAVGRTSDEADALPRAMDARCVLFGDFELDLHEQTLRRGGEAVKVPGKIYQAMVVLVESPGNLVTREHLRTRLWPRDAHLNYDANVNTTVNKLRQVLGDTSEGSNFIQTVPRQGYSFVAPVRYADAPTPKPSEERIADTDDSRRLTTIGEALRSERARIWFMASVVTWVTAALLFGAVMLWHAHRAQNAVKSSAQVVDKLATDKR
jgi:DNA-binding winged helix-turn-helix (wHTH) protein